MLDLTLFRKPAFAGASIVAFALSASMFSMFLYLTLYLQNVARLLAAGGRPALPAATCCRSSWRRSSGKLAGARPGPRLCSAAAWRSSARAAARCAASTRTRAGPRCWPASSSPARASASINPRSRRPRSASSSRGAAAWRRASTTRSARSASRPASPASARSSSTLVAAKIVDALGAHRRRSRRPQRRPGLGSPGGCARPPDARLRHDAPPSAGFDRRAERDPRRRPRSSRFVGRASPRSLLVRRERLRRRTRAGSRSRRGSWPRAAAGRAPPRARRLRDARAGARGRRPAARAAARLRRLGRHLAAVLDRLGPRAAAARSRSTCRASATADALRAGRRCCPQLDAFAAAAVAHARRGGAARRRRRRQLARRLRRAARRPSARDLPLRRGRAGRARRPRHAALVLGSSSATRSCARCCAAPLPLPEVVVRARRRRGLPRSSPSRAPRAARARGRRRLHRAPPRPRRGRRACSATAAGCCPSSTRPVRAGAIGVPGAARVGRPRPHGPARGARHVLAALPGRRRYELLDGVRPLPAGRGARALRRRCCEDFAAQRSSRSDADRRCAIPRHPSSVADAAANVFDMVVPRRRRRPAPRRPRGSSTRRRSARSTATSRRRRRAARDLPVLLVPPLAAPTICFDLRRGCSLAEHLLAPRAPDLPASSTATIAFSDRDLGLEHWVDDVLPDARSARVSEDAGGAPGAARRLVPGRDHVAARARRATRRCRSTRSRWSPARSTSRRCGSIAPIRADGRT